MERKVEGGEMKTTPVRHLRGVLGLVFGVGVAVALLYLAGLLDPLGRATGFVAGPVATGAGAAIGAVVGGLAAFGAIMFAIASAGFAMGAVWFVGGKLAALSAGGATLLVTGLAVLALLSEHLSAGGRRDDSDATAAGMSMGLTAAVLAAVGPLVAVGPWAAVVAGLAAGVVTGGVVGWVISSLSSL